jgi:Leucine-rich repeat (LRR) protein
MRPPCITIPQRPAIKARLIKFNYSLTNKVDIMQVNTPNNPYSTIPSISSAPSDPQPLLPLHGYQNRINSTAQVLPIRIIGLPAELITLILHFCSFRDLLTLTSVNKMAFASRFDNLQRISFKMAAEVEQFLLHCRETPQTAALNGKLRTREDFCEVNMVSLSLSDRLTLTQCIPLFAHLPAVSYLNITPAPEQGLASLSPLLKAAKYLTLQHLTIARPAYRPKLELEDTLPDELWQWPNLKTLELRACKGITHISEDIGKLTQLTSLSLSPRFGGDSSLLALPESLGQLTKLAKLTLMGFSGLSALPKSIGQLQALKSLELMDLNLITFPSSLWRLRQLEHLVLYKLKNIQSIKQMSELTALKSLIVEDMESLKILPANLERLSKLEKLSLINLYNYGITSISAEIGRLQALKSLVLNAMYSDKITKIPEEIGYLKALESLTLTNMRSLKTLPVSLGQLANLTQLKLLALRSIKALPEEIGQLTHLKVLKIKHLEALQTLPKSLVNLVSLEKLILNSLPALIKLPEAIWELKNLQTIKLYSMPAHLDVPKALKPLIRK